jgi:hypothetical protein
VVRSYLNDPRADTDVTSTGSMMFLTCGASHWPTPTCRSEQTIRGRRKVQAVEPRILSPAISGPSVAEAMLALGRAVNDAAEAAGAPTSTIELIGLRAHRRRQNEEGP